jgi:putative transposase
MGSDTIFLDPPPRFRQAGVRPPGAGEEIRLARLPRYFVPGLPLHVIQRGNNRAPVFFAPEDQALFRDWLTEAAAAEDCAVHAYVLMTNHIHLLATPARADSLPRLMQSLGRRYVGYVNRARGRTGTLWEGRYRATPVDTERYLLACCRYIEENPVRARLVRRPARYPWSSHRRLAEGAADPLVTPHPVYEALGRTAAARQSAYAELFRDRLDKAALEAIRTATHLGWALGDDAFRARVAQAAGRAAAPRPRGRPPKHAENGV